MKFKFKKKEKQFNDPYSFKNAITYGDKLTKLSMFIMGAGSFGRKRIVKGLLYLLGELGYLLYMVVYGFSSLALLVTLGSVKQGEVYNASKGIYEYTAGDNSVLSYCGFLMLKVLIRDKC